MKKIENSELIITSAGCIYHLNLHPDFLADTIFLVGDPDRVPLVSKHFDTITHKASHREFVTHCGVLRNKQVMCVSTGIGTDNIDIVLNELDALATIDFTTRMPLQTPKSLTLIRIGTSGSLQHDIPVDSFVVSEAAIGTDGLLNYYATDLNSAMTHAFCTQVNYPQEFARPYSAPADSQLTGALSTFAHRGITVTACGFYAPQGRHLRMQGKYPDLVNRFSAFTFENSRITNFEMETSAIYGLSGIMGHKCCSVSAIVANRVAGTFSRDAQSTVEKLIQLTLEAII
jgi:uridine phosphorylase